MNHTTNILAKHSTAIHDRRIDVTNNPMSRVTRVQCSFNRAFDLYRVAANVSILRMTRVKSITLTNLFLESSISIFLFAFGDVSEKPMFILVSIGLDSCYTYT